MIEKKIKELLHSSIIFDDLGNDSPWVYLELSEIIEIIEKVVKKYEYTSSVVNKDDNSNAAQNKIINNKSNRIKKNNQFGISKYSKFPSALDRKK